MKQETIERLLALNAAFYERSARAFSATRSAPWPGWARLLDRFDRPISVLDLGCGNGRFLDELLRRDLVCDYLGVDTSEALLELARAAHPEHRFVHADAIELPTERFDLAVAFGLLHHLPSFALRERFMRSLADRAELACITFWRFADRPRFQRKLLPVEDGEPGDHLLAFAEEGPRYCHQASDDEIARLLEASGMRETDRWLADGETGDLNLYAVVGRSERS